MTIDRLLTQNPEYVQGRNMLDGRTIVVTAGAGAGIGGTTAMRCLEEGARAVIVGDVHEGRLNKLDEELAERFGRERVATVRCDVTNEDEVNALLDAAEPFGGVDVLINNAGLGGNAPVQDMTDDEWSRVIDVTLTGVFRCTRAAARRMIDRKSGGIVVNNASVVGWEPVAAMSHYSAAKGGVMAFTRSSAMDLAPHGIRVNAVSPSMVMHPHLERVTSKGLLDQRTAAEAFGRSAEAWEVANVIVFLASDYSSYMTGEVVSVSCQHP